MPRICVTTGRLPTALTEMQRVIAYCLKACCYQLALRMDRSELPFCLHVGRRRWRERTTVSSAGAEREENEARAPPAPADCTPTQAIRSTLQRVAYLRACGQDEPAMPDTSLEVFGFLPLLGAGSRGAPCVRHLRVFKGHERLEYLLTGCSFAPRSSKGRSLSQAAHAAILRSQDQMSGGATNTVKLVRMLALCYHMRLVLWKHGGGK